ncbi:acylphosphatase [Vibrio spartinae]|uniref:Acylphosphatase n=1 Tax=Vibrio spartinae TaxID=1918945 RepID=A0A1N6M3E1_9VIBR|nr:acylphosphatase [Vibrio spartinae]QMV14387.1 Acylphosphatase [Vibrio spartinae]SIO93866.1 Acylphosphatase [Vibrio spartinae]
MSQKREIFTVKGVVQGVGFRYYTSHQGLKLGLTGYAKNLHNGDVEVVACGEAEQLELFYQWLHEGSPAARVEAVMRNDFHGEQSFRGFSIHS